MEPQIYLVFGKYFAQNANCESFLRNVAKVEQNYKDDDERAICLIKNGLSLSSAVLLIKKYNSYLQINVSSSTVVFDDALISEMKKENENQILIYEVQNCM